MNEQEIRCDSCGLVLNNTDRNCYKCGSNRRVINLFFNDSIEGFDCINAKTKDNTKTGKRKITEEFIIGNEQSFNGDWVYKVRIINRDRNYYFEKVEKLDGTVLRFCEEKLSKHISRGQAKSSKSD